MGQQWEAQVLRETERRWDWCTDSKVMTGRNKRDLPAIFPNVLLRLETGTAAKIFFTGKTDFFLVVLVRRVLAFPSGWLFARKVDVNLLVSLLGGRLRLAVPVRRGKDAEGHGDTGFKVQIGDFCLARESSHTTFRNEHERMTRSPLAFVFGTKVEEGGEGKREGKVPR